MRTPRRRAARPLLCFALLSLARADNIWSGGPCLSACQLCLNYVAFAGAAPDAPFLEKQCEGGLRATSLYLCAGIYCPGVDVVEGLRPLNESCRGINSSLPGLDVVAGFTEEEREAVRRIDAVGEEGGGVYGEIVVPSEKFLQLAADTMEAVDYVNKYHDFYGSMVSWFWAAVILIGTLRHMVHVFNSTQPRSDHRLVHDEDSDRETLLIKGKPRGLERASLQFRRFVTVPATFGHRCLQNVGWCTIPPRVETLTILIFFILNVAFSVHGYFIFKGNLYFPPTSKQVWRYVSDRTGILSWASFPAIWLFGMRNNLLVGMTGWDFGTFNNFHRWVARIATLQAVIHSVGYTVIVSRKGGWPYFIAYWEQLFWWTGEVATIAMCALVAVSLFWLRRNIYEAFLVMHIVLSVIVLVTMLFHVSIFLGQYDTPFWVCLYIWLADRLLRSIRVLAFNPWFWSTRATLSYSPASNTVRLVVPSSTSAYRARPGTYYYVYLLSDSRPWESHPFTMAYASAAGDGPASGETSPLLPDDACPVSSCGSESPSMTFLIRPYDGFTSRLRDLSMKNGSARVLIEGPYGMTHPLDTFHDVLFVAGGSGVAVPLAYLSTLSASPRVRSVRIVWSLREAGFVAEILRRGIGDALQSGKVSFDVFLTRAGPENDLDLEDYSKEVSVTRGRPDVSTEIKCAAQGAMGATVAVVACGPAEMADEARRSVVGILGEGHHRVEYFQEAFNW